MTPSESDILRQIRDYLDIEMAREKLYYDRLNSGKILALYGKIKRMIHLCRDGTADIIVLKGYYLNPINFRICRVIYLEVKGPKGKQREEQKEFQGLVEAQGAEYYVVRDLDSVMEILE